MSHTPDVIIDKTAKFVHDVFNWIGGAAGLVALSGMLMGGNFLPPLLVAIGCGYVASRIKFKLVKRVEAARYERV